MAIPGRKSVVKVSTDTVAELNDANFAINGESIDVSVFGNAGWRDRITGLRDATINISGFYAPTDATGQAALRAGILAGTQVDDVTVLADSAVATSGFTGNFFVSSFEISPAVTNAVEVSITLESTGAITVSS